MNVNHIHFSWKPLLRELNTDTFLYFKNEVLPKEKYYPESSEVFRVFSMPVSQIKIVVIGPWKGSDSEKIQTKDIFWLPFSFTQGAELDHTPYWENFIKKIVFFIAKSKPAIWVLPTIKSQSFTANLPVKSIFNVISYNDKTINEIPINVDYNYIFKGKFINIDHINVVLKKLKN
jgi:uracil-DNA glycosylase